MEESNKAIRVSQIIERIQIILGMSFAVFMMIVAVYAMFDEVEDGVGIIIVIWMLSLLGLWMYFCGHKRRKMRLEYDKYMVHFLDDDAYSLTNLAALTGTKVEIVKKNIEYMIQRKFFDNAYIDEEKNCLVFPLEKNNDTCKCPNCGGVNKVVRGVIIECDYCGSYIRG